MAIYYIADLHIGHANIIKFDNRPFADLNEMHSVIVDNWNRVVRGDDTVYILGDFCWAKESEWPFYLGPLAGQKVLIRGNHDPKQFSQTTKKFLADVKDYKEITDNGRHVILSHYPIPFHKADYNPDCWMLYGHVHTTREYDFMEKLRQEGKPYRGRPLRRQLDQCGLHDAVDGLYAPDTGRNHRAGKECRLNGRQHKNDEETEGKTSVSSLFQSKGV